jgi:hypothetical protein
MGTPKTAIDGASSSPRLPTAKTGIGRDDMTEAAQSRREAGRDRDRIVNLGYGVFAIAIILLVLDIHAPDIPEDIVATELPGELISMWPRYLGYRGVTFHEPSIES